MPSKKSRKVQYSPQEQLRRSIINTYGDRFNSIKELARSYGVKPETAREWLDKISSGEMPIESEKRASRYLERREEAGKFFEGDKEAKEVYSRDFEDNSIRDYEIQPGSFIPSNEITNNAWGYQIIIKGEMNGKEQYMTSSWAETPQDALSEIAYILASYPRFKGAYATVRVIARYYD